MSTDLIPPSRGVSRRSLMGGAGLAALSLAGLSACGGGETTGGSGGGASAGAGSPVTAKAADIPVGSGKIFADAKTVITQPVAGEFKAFSSICTHAGCPVAEVLDTINCKCHGSKFSLADGSPQGGPANKPLPAKTVKVEGDSLSVA